MNTYRADRNAAHVLQILCLLLTGLFCLVTWTFLRPYAVLLFWLWAAAICLAILFSCILAPLGLQSVSCIITSGQITLKTGIFLHREQSVRYDSIQFVQVIRGPFDGKWGMNFILLHLCGGRLLLPFLRQKDCKALLKLLRNKGVFHAP